METKIINVQDYKGLSTFENGYVVTLNGQQLWITDFGGLFYISGDNNTHTDFDTAYDAAVKLLSNQLIAA